MKQRNCKIFCLAIVLLAIFVIWTIFVCLIDVQPIGPQGSTVGFATINAWFHSFTGVSMFLYTVTDWLGLLPIATVFGFALLGLMQWIRRKSIKRVDPDLLILGAFYLWVLIIFIFFEIVVINYRPILIEGVLEASYPSSTTMLSLCMLPTAAMQVKARIQHKTLRRCLVAVLIFLAAFMVIGRLISGVHWLSDILGGLLLSAGLVGLYASVTLK